MAGDEGENMTRRMARDEKESTKTGKTTRTRGQGRTGDEDKKQLHGHGPPGRGLEHEAHREDRLNVLL